MRRLAVEAAADTAAVTAAEAATVPSVVDSSARGMFIRVFSYTNCLLIVLRCSYTCGGVGHLSRDCVQGSKCYNCSGFVSSVRSSSRREVECVLFVGTHLQGLPAAPATRLLHLRL